MEDCQSVCLYFQCQCYTQETLEELSVEKKRVMTLGMSSLASNKYLVRVYFVCTVISAKQR